mgnify:CR=1 FL=1
MLLEMKDIVKVYGQVVANDHVSFSLDKGEILAVVGENGAGKSTTLKMITGILRPTSGSIEFDGHAWKRSDLNHIGTLIEMPPLYENLTA